MGFLNKLKIFLTVAFFGIATISLSTDSQACESRPKTKTKNVTTAKHFKKNVTEPRKFSKLTNSRKSKTPSKVRIIDTGAKPAPVTHPTYSKANLKEMQNDYFEDLERPIEDFLTPHESDSGVEN